MQWNGYGELVLTSITAIVGGLILFFMKRVVFRFDEQSKELKRSHKEAIDALNRQIDVVANKSEERGKQQQTQELRLVEMGQEIKTMVKAVDVLVLSQKEQTHAIVRLTTIMEERDRNRQAGEK